MKTKKIIKDTAYYGLAIPTAIVVDTTMTAVVRLAQATAATVKAPVATARYMAYIKRNPGFIIDK